MFCVYMVASTVTKPPIKEKSAPNSVSAVRSGLMPELPLVDAGISPLIPPVLEDDKVVNFALGWGMFPVSPLAKRSFKLSNTPANSPN